MLSVEFTLTRSHVLYEGINITALVERNIVFTYNTKKPKLFLNMIFDFPIEKKCFVFSSFTVNHRHDCLLRF